MFRQRNMLKAVIVSIIAVMLISACSNNSGNAPSGGTTTNAGGSQTDSGAGNAGGQGGEPGKLLADPMTLQVTVRSGAVQPILKNSPALDEIERKTNVTIDLQLVPDTGYAEKLQTLLATNNITDIMYVNQGNTHFIEAANNGMFLPISDYMEHMPNFAKKLEENPDINLLRVNGKLYSFPTLGDWRLQLAATPVIRADLLEELNLDIPETFDDLYNVLKAFKQAYPDKIPYTNRLGAANILPSLSFAMGSGYKIYYDPDVDGGRYVYGPAYDDFKPVLEFLSKLYSEKLLDPDYAVNTAGTWQEKMSSDKALFFNDNNVFADNFNKVLQETNPKAKLDLLPVLKNHKGQQRNYMYAKNWLNSYAISANVKDPVSVVKFFDWMYSDEGTWITNYGIEGEHFRLENGQPVIMESVLDKYMQTADPFRVMQSELGTGSLNFAVNIDEHTLAATSSPDLVAWGERITEANGYFPLPGLPPLNDEELEQVKLLKSKVDTIVDQEIDKFIMGATPISEFGNFAQRLRDNGALEMEKIYNDAQKRFNDEYLK